MFKKKSHNHHYQFHHHNNNNYYGSSPQKRPHEHSGSDISLSKPHKLSKSNDHQMVPKKEEKRFTFEEVKMMIEKLISAQGKSNAAVCAGLRRVNYEDVAVEGHSVEACKELIEHLVQNTRRIRTLSEVLHDINGNLKKRTYTEIIHKATLKEDLPKKPPSAYLLYHADRYNQLRGENSLAVEISKIVAEEWKTLPDKKKREYQRRHQVLVNLYEDKMRRLGLVDKVAPKRPKSAKSLFIQDCLTDFDIENWTKERLSTKKEELSNVFENLLPEEKAKWISMHKENQDTYKRQKAEYIAAHPHLDHTVAERKSRVSDKIKPPEPAKSPLKIFIAKKMPDGLEGEEFDTQKKLLKDKFKQLRSKKLLKYIKKAVQDRERYEREVKQFKLDYPDKEVPKTKANLSKEHLKLYSKLVENRPELPPPTAYLYYCGKLLTDMNDNDDGQVPTKRMKSASIAWKGASVREKGKAVREHMADIDRYINEMENWLSKQTEQKRIQVLAEDPKVNPDYWRKRLNRFRKSEAKATRMKLSQSRPGA